MSHTRLRRTRQARILRVVTKCAAGPCYEPRVDGSSFCDRHGPRGQAHSHTHGAHLVPEMVCPHCHTPGRVRTERVKTKRGISGAKATGAVLTAGFSILGTGLSRKVEVTRAACGNCGQRWDF